jgi:hypothetical protein
VIAMRRIVGWMAAIVGVIFLGGIVAGIVQTSANANPCPDAQTTTIGQIDVPRGPVAGYCQSELVNAAKIMTAARDMGIGTRTQTVGVMTAIGESKLRNLDHGDAAGPDSRGVFQQRDNGAWGTLAERMDPYISARTFFTKLTKVPGWQTMDPTSLAHAVQVNADAGYYSQFWSRAQRIVATLTPSAN